MMEEECSVVEEEKCEVEKKMECMTVEKQACTTMREHVTHSPEIIRGKLKYLIQVCSPSSETVCREEMQNNCNLVQDVLCRNVTQTK